MATQPLERVHSLRLRAFDVSQASVVASWVRSDEEARMLAPRVAPPMGIETILGWAGPGLCQFVLAPADAVDHFGTIRSQTDEQEHAIVGYGELNELDPARRSYWLGHLIIDPAQRGMGYGLQLTRLLVARAFERCGARRVTLVVFPENLTAVACYKRAGFEPDGFENHRSADGRSFRLLRMAVEQ